MIDQLNKYKGLLILIGMIATGIWWFTPMSYSKETRQMIVELSMKEQLK
jgi:hypothetical protein